MRSFKTEGIIIKRRNYGEADRLLTVLTKNNGKIQVKATGIRRIPSRRSPHVELLNHSILGLYRGRSYAILTEAEAIDNFSSIKDNLEKIGQAYHLCELVDGLCPENQENTRVFFLLKKTLIQLSALSCHSLSSLCHSREGGNPYTPQANTDFSIIREFEIELLIILGYLPAGQAGLPAGRQGLNNSHAYSYNFDTNNFIENIIERKLKSCHIFAKLQ